MLSAVRFVSTTYTGSYDGRRICLTALGYLNRETLRIEAEDRHASYFDKWEAWASATERDRVGSKPLFTSPAPADQT